jgi:hypothetical protein
MPGRRVARDQTKKTLEITNDFVVETDRGRTNESVSSDLFRRRDRPVAERHERER